MADELNLALQYSYAKGGVAITKTAVAAVDVAGVVSTTGVVSVGTTAESLAFGDVPAVIGSAGYVLLRNLDTTPSTAPVNVIVFGDANTCLVGKLKGGLSDGSVAPDFAILRWNAAAIWVKAITVPQLLEYVLLPD
jgi:hypothetical protein